VKLNITLEYTLNNICYALGLLQLDNSVKNLLVII